MDGIDHDSHSKSTKGNGQVWMASIKLGSLHQTKYFCEDKPAGMA